MKYALFRAALFYMTLKLLAIAGAAVLLLALLGFLLARRKRAKVGTALSIVFIVLGLGGIAPLAYWRIRNEVENTLYERKTRADDGELITAVKALDSQRVRELLEAGADVGYKNSYQHTALTEACCIHAYEEAEIAALSEIVRLLAEFGADIEYASGYYVLPPLCECIEYGTSRLVPVLLELGADVNRKSERGSPFALAVEKGDILCARALLEGGVDPFLHDDSRLLVGVCRDFRAYQGGSEHALGRVPEMLPFLLEAGFDPNARDLHRYDGKGRTPLHYVCGASPVNKWGARPQAVRLLLQYGAKADAHDDDGKTPLDYARERYESTSEYEESFAEYEEIRRLLADINIFK